MTCGDGQHCGLAQQHGTGHQIGLLDRCVRHQEVDLAGAQLLERVEETGLEEPDLRTRVAALEAVEDVDDEVGHGWGFEAHGQDSVHATSCRDSRCDPAEHLFVPGSYIVAQLPADGCQGHVPAGPLEQCDSEPAFERGNGLADPGLGHEQALRCPAEVEFVSQGEKDLDLPTFHKAQVIGPCQV